MSAVLSLVEIEGKGRGYVATEPLKGGQVVLRESPILVFSARSLRCLESQDDRRLYSRHCAHCYKSLAVGDTGDTATLTCPLCSHPDGAIFCCLKCQSLALSSTHSPWVCKALGYLRNCPLLLDDQPQERQVQARYLVTAYNLAMISPSAFQTLLSLHGDGERYMETATFLHSIFSLPSFPVGIPASSVETTAALLDKETNNSFNLMEPVQESRERGIRAYGIYPNVSFFNHSCMPNACRFEYLDSANHGNTDITIRVLHDVPQGEEICLSYVRVNRNYHDRKNRLLEYFGFACLCDRCKVVANWNHEDCDSKADSGLKLNCENNKFTPESRENDSNYANFAKKFVCDKENCGGTMAPLPPSDDNGYSTDYMECNYCGSLQKSKL